MRVMKAVIRIFQGEESSLARLEIREIAYFSLRLVHKRKFWLYLSDIQLNDSPRTTLSQGCGGACH